MNTQKNNRTELRLIAIGLLLVILPFLINDWVHIPDAIRGFFMGLGLTMEIIGLIRMNRKRKMGTPNC